MYFPRFSALPQGESDVPIGDSHPLKRVYSVVSPAGEKGALVSISRGNGWGSQKRRDQPAKSLQKVQTTPSNPRLCKSKRDFG